MSGYIRSAIGVLILLVSGSVWAHSFGRTFTLPIPFSMYAWASVATLAATFLLMIFRRPSLNAGVQDKGYFYDADPANTWGNLAARTIGLVTLLLAIYSGLEGTQRRPDNFNMTWFWIIWMLLLVYISGLLGNLYRSFNPFRNALDFFWWLWRLARLPIPSALVPQIPNRVLHAAALLGLIALSGYELFGQSRPFDLSLYLCGYLVWCAACSALVGRKRFFEEGCFFTVYFELISRNASSLKGFWGRAPKPNLHTPLSSLWMVALVVGLFATTALDGIIDTQWWIESVWPAFAQTLAPWVSDQPQALLANPMWVQLELGGYFKAFEKTCLILGPLLLGLLFLLVLKATQLLANQSLPLELLARAFAPSLIPIVLVYSFSHYFTLILTQGVQIVHLFSDPLAQGTNFVGTRNWWRAPVLLDAQIIWNIQLASVLAGHVFAAIIAHDAAFKIFSNRRQANLSQIPLLTLMIGLTILGLWILSQPARIG